jgi:hypothetical protein
MVKATRYIGMFFLSVAISALIGWMAAQSPGFCRFAQWGLLFALVLGTVAGLADDGICAALKLNQLTYYAIVLSLTVAIGFGGLAGWLSAAV